MPAAWNTVRSLSVAQVREIYELREVIEPHALRRCVGTLSAARLARLRKLAARLDSSPDGADFVEIRVEFYRELYDAEANPRLVKMVEDLRARSAATFSASVSRTANAQVIAN